MNDREPFIYIKQMYMKGFFSLEDRCKEKILSEDYWDFIISPYREDELEGVDTEKMCIQELDFGYKSVSLDSRMLLPLSLRQYWYGAIPKCYTLLDMQPLDAAGIITLQNYPTLQLMGEGIMIGFLDTGIDYTNPLLRDPDGSTRIAAIWDQTIQSGTPPQGFAYGTEYARETINAALSSEDPASLVPSVDDTGHGTFVASLAAGGADISEQFLGAAPECTIAMVKLKTAKQYLKEYYCIASDAVCYQETDLLLGVKYLNDLASALDLPLVMCITVGTNMGGHVGTLPLPSQLGAYSLVANRIAVIGTGNEADKRHHYYNTIQNLSDTKTVEIRVGENVSGFMLELWVMIPNILSISIISPSGENSSRISFRVGSNVELDFLFEKTKVYVNYRLMVEKTNSELVFFRFNTPAAGIWKIVVEPVRLIDGQFHMWLPVTEFLDGEVYFLESDPYYTLTNPANAPSPIIVSYYDGKNGGLAQASGRGYTRTQFQNPSITAPGINVKGALPGGRFTVRSGSCISTAITAGAVALMLEWELEQKNITGIDVFQIKSLLILGAIRPDFLEYPNREWGYGQLNLYNTFEAMRQL